MYACVQYVCISLQRPEEDIRGSILLFSTLFPSMESSTEQKFAILTMLADQNAPWIFLSPPPVLG